MILMERCCAGGGEYASSLIGSDTRSGRFQRSLADGTHAESTDRAASVRSGSRSQLLAACGTATPRSAQAPAAAATAAPTAPAATAAESRAAPSSRGPSPGCDIPCGFANADAARTFRRYWWPATGAITVVLGPDRVPRLEQVKDRLSLSDTAGYVEFLIQRLANASELALSGTSTSSPVPSVVR
jgi:hypothetical protein